MLDLHGNSSGGSNPGYGAIGTILLGQDGQTVAGLPIGDGANLVGWGGLTTIADTINKIKMFSQDQLDPANTEEIILGAASVAGIHHEWDFLPFKTGSRTVSMAQNTGAANNISYFLDYYPQNPPRPPIADSRIYGRSAANWKGGQVFSGALTALTWGSQAFAPATILPAGIYSLNGVRVSQLTNYALIRFQHADFGAWLPGFPVLDQTKAAARAVVNVDPLFQRDEHQFEFLSDLLGKPLVPVFKVGAQSTGLVIQMASITADTPQVTLNLSKISD